MELSDWLTPLTSLVSAGISEDRNHVVLFFSDAKGNVWVGEVALVNVLVQLLPEQQQAAIRAAASLSA